MPSMQSSDVTAERLQRLATSVAPDGARVLSLYLNLDPRQDLATGQARQTAITSLLDEAERRIEGEEDLDHDVHMALREDVRRARAELDEHLQDDWAEGAHALALFVCGPADLFEVVRLPRPVDARVIIADRPAIGPLVEAAPLRHWAVLLLDGDDARLLEAHGDRLEEVQSLSGDHRGRTSAGGMSAQRYERSVGMEESEFLRQAADLLRQADERASYEQILVGTTPRMFSEFEGHLAQHVRERIGARFDVDADHASPTEVRERVEPLLQQDETRHEGDVLGQMRANGVRGLADVLPALYERRVQTLLLEPGLEHPGAVCPRCRWAVPEEAGSCPVDGETLVPHENILEWAVEMAVEQSAEVLVLRHHEDLGESDGIGAALRF